MLLISLEKKKKKKKTEILPSHCSVSTIAWLNHLDFNEMLEEKARWEPHKDATCYLEQILKTIPNKTAAVRPLTSYLTNHQNKTNKTCQAQLEKQGLTHK